MSVTLEEGRTTETDAKLSLANKTNGHTEIGEEAIQKIDQALKQIKGLTPKDAISHIERELFKNEQRK